MKKKAARKRFDVHIHLVCSSEDGRRLAELARKDETTQSDVLRQLIRREHKAREDSKVMAAGERGFTFVKRKRAS